MTLEEIIEGCRKGDVAMQKKLYDRFSGKFYVLCRRYSTNDASAQEALSDGFLCVFEQIGNYKGHGSFEGWMRTIMVRCAIKLFKQEHPVGQSLDVEEASDTIVEVVDHEKRMDVQKALLCSMRRLSENECPIFNLIAIENYKFEEASLILGENVSTLKSRYYKALQKMKTMLRVYLGNEYINQ